MSAADLIHVLAARGVEFSVRGDRLIIDAPKGALRSYEIDRLHEHKAEVLTLLKSHAEIAPVFHSPSAPTEAPDLAGEALVILARLKGYTVPSGRMAAARATSERNFLVGGGGVAHDDMLDALAFSQNPDVQKALVWPRATDGRNPNDVLRRWGASEAIQLPAIFPNAFSRSSPSAIPIGVIPSSAVSPP